MNRFYGSKVRIHQGMRMSEPLLQVLIPLPFTRLILDTFCISILGISSRL